jgi:hypothetical protein
MQSYASALKYNDETTEQSIVKQVRTFEIHSKAIESLSSSIRSCIDKNRRYSYAAIQLFLLFLHLFSRKETNRNNKYP